MQRKVSSDHALKRKYPEPVVMISTRAPNGRVNVMTAAWHAIVSGDPLMFMVAIDSEALTYSLIRKTRQFTLAFPAETMGAVARFAGTHHGHTLDKIAATGLKLQQPHKIKAPLIAEASANFECTVMRIVQPGDCPLIIGKVVSAHVSGKATRRLYTLAKGYKLGGVRPFRKNGKRTD